MGKRVIYLISIFGKGRELLRAGVAKFFYKGQSVNMYSFVGQMVSLLLVIIAHKQQ